MLSQLHIENIAVIENMDILLGQGLNLLTGETGAGKSIVIDALGAVLGGRTSRELIRAGAGAARASAVFWKPGGAVTAWLGESLGIAVEDDELQVSRDILSDGRTVCRVCGRPVTVAQLRDLGALLIQVHGQHDSQLLLDEGKHLSLVDAFSQCGGLLGEYQARYGEWNSLCAQRDALLKTAADKARHIDMLHYQIDEINAAGLSAGEDVRLAERRALLKNAHKVSAAVEEAYALLYGGDETPGARDLLSQASNRVASVSHVSAELGELARRVEELTLAADDAAEEVRGLRGELDADPAELEQIEHRLDRIYRLKKYGSTVDEIIEFGQNLEAELDGTEHAEQRLAELEAACKAKELDVEKTAAALSEKRRAGAALLEKTLCAELRGLEMEKVKFLIEVSPAAYGRNGGDAARFMISVNPGEPPRPLSKIASGGELSRVMLALMSVMAGEVDTMVFDEVDSGVSGRAAQRVAEKLARLSQKRQVLCVTHLPQIAAMADHHFHIEKKALGGRTVTGAEPLDKPGRVAEIARIIGGAEVTDVTRQSAAELIGQADLYKGGETDESI